MIKIETHDECDVWQTQLQGGKLVEFGCVYTYNACKKEQQQIFIEIFHTNDEKKLMLKSF